MVRLRQDPKYATRWDGRELQDMDDAAWERHNRLGHADLVGGQQDLDHVVRRCNE